MHKKQKIGQNRQSNIKTRDDGLLKDLQLKNMNAPFLACICDVPSISHSSLKAEDPEGTAEFSNQKADVLEYSPQKRCCGFIETTLQVAGSQSVMWEPAISWNRFGINEE